MKYYWPTVIGILVMVAIVLAANRYGGMSMSYAAPPAAKVEQVSPGFVLGAPGCFEYQLTPDGVFIVNTSTELTLEKGKLIFNKVQGYESGTAAGKALYDRLMKVGPVDSVTIAHRQAAVRVQPFPPGAWDKCLKDVLKEVESVLCAK